MRHRIKHFMPKIHLGLERWKYYMPLDCYISNYGHIKDANGVPQSVGAQNNYLVYRGKFVHRLVMECWAPVPNYACLTVDHKDHNTRNNAVYNLEWVTKEENQHRAAVDQALNIVAEAASIATENIMVKLNGAVIPLEAARTIMQADPTLSNDKIKKTFNIITNNTASTAQYGNYKLEKVG